MSARGYSIRPRRIALATAAARSETPSFSYRCCTCVLTVVSPRKSSFAISGRLLPAAIRCRISCSRGRQRRRVVPLAESDLRHETGGDVGRDDVVAASAREHGVDDLLALRLLRDEAGRAGLQRLVDDAAVGERRDEQHACRELLAHDRVDDRHPVELGELVVEQGDVGQVLPNLGQRRPPVLGLGDDLDLPARHERSHDAFAIQRVVVRDEDP